MIIRHNVLKFIITVLLICLRVKIEHIHILEIFVKFVSKIVFGEREYLLNQKLHHKIEDQN